MHHIFVPQPDGLLLSFFLNPDLNGSQKVISFSKLGFKSFTEGVYFALFFIITGSSALSFFLFFVASIFFLLFQSEM